MFNSTNGNGYSLSDIAAVTSGYGYGPAIILVLFILLVIIFGVGFLNNGNSGCNSCN